VGESGETSRAGIGGGVVNSALRSAVSALFFGETLRDRDPDGKSFTPGVTTSGSVGDTSGEPSSVRARSMSTFGGWGRLGEDVTGVSDSGIRRGEGVALSAVFGASIFDGVGSLRGAVVAMDEYEERAEASDDGKGNSVSGERFMRGVVGDAGSSFSRTLLAFVGVDLPRM